MGNGTNTDDNLADFQLNPSPLPQNTGSPPSPGGDPGLSLNLSAPETIAPGTQFEYTLTLTNKSDGTLNDIEARFPVPTGFEIVSLPNGLTQIDDILYWKVEEMEPDESLSLST